MDEIKKPFWCEICEVGGRMECPVPADVSSRMQGFDTCPAFNFDRKYCCDCAADIYVASLVKMPAWKGPVACCPARASLASESDADKECIFAATDSLRGLIRLSGEISVMRDFTKWFKVRRIADAVLTENNLLMLAELMSSAVLTENNLLMLAELMSRIR